MLQLANEMVLPGLSTPYPLLLSLVCLITKLRFSVVEHSSEQVLLKKASLVLDVKDPPATAGNLDLIPGPGRPYTPQSSYAGVPQLLSLNSRAHEAPLQCLHAATTEICAPRACVPRVTTVRNLCTAMKSSPAHHN